MVYILRINTETTDIKEAVKLHDEMASKIDGEKDTLITLPNDASLCAFAEEGAIDELDRIAHFIYQMKDELGLYKRYKERRRDI